MKKLLIASMAASILSLTACNSSDDTTKEEPKEEAVVDIDFAQSAEQYKTEVTPLLTSLVEDAALLKKHIEEGKFEEASKLYPFVHMKLEQLKPLASNFDVHFKALEVKAEEGKELEAGGFQAIEYALYEKKDANLAKEAVSKLATDITTFAEDALKATLDGKKVLDSADAMLEDTIANKLKAEKASAAGNEVYDAQANLDALQAIVKSYEKNADAEKAKELTDQLTKALDVVAFYEVGKEDYVKYSFFTSKQKQELIDTFEKVKKAYEQYVKAMK